MRAELLAPAGDYECFMAAVNAGADAVYLGGSKFGARAYANNFTQEEIIRALSVAHLFGRKIYLTVNTLVKESEMPELVPYIKPLYEAGLDGVIVQDIGALKLLGENFPGLALHASTQMTVTGVYGANLLKDFGVCRVVPARELSLEEIADIRTGTGLEVECFIHGAMCYAYSGQCLFSSILGGRSGNRGRCAGPCRLPYRDKSGWSGNRLYPLSLKDMYTLSLLPKLIETGITSFKIEGRMKKPEYVAGVTSVYRKYIDKYYAAREKGLLLDAFQIEKEDEELLRGLYIRSDICSGYYEKHNGRDMVTMHEPGYRGSQKETLEAVREKYVDKKPVLPISGRAYVFAGKPAKLTLYTQEASVTVEGAVADAALNRPLTEQDISERLSKLGDTCFALERFDVHTDLNSFMPVKALNGLRRSACIALEDALLKKHERKAPLRDIHVSDAEEAFKADKARGANEPAVLVSVREQLEAALSFEDIRIIYIEADLFLSDGNRDIKTLIERHDRQYFLALPHILRKRSYQYLEKYNELLQSGLFAGVLVRNLEELGWLNGLCYQGRKISDFGVYAWNNATLAVYSGLFDRVTLPLELNRRELSGLSCGVEEELLVYGRLPLMYSANCVRKSLSQCICRPDSQNVYLLEDRYRNTFPVVQNCRHCYNILYNTVPLSLHERLEELQRRGFRTLRLDFTLEDGAQTKSIIEFYLKKRNGEAGVFASEAFTNGHYKRGVE